MHILVGGRISRMSSPNGHCRHQYFMSEIAAIVSAAAQHSSRKLGTAISNKTSSLTVSRIPASWLRNSAKVTIKGADPSAPLASARVAHRP
jgi:hypothetical protein